MNISFQGSVGKPSGLRKDSALPSARGPSIEFSVSTVLIALIWLELVVALALDGAFLALSQSPPIAMLLAIALPPAVFITAMRAAPAFRRNVLSINPVWFAAVHGLRIVGAGFLFVYAFGHLPGIFAFTAGGGDVLVALLAPFVATRLAMAPDFLRSGWLRGFHVLGLVDFVGAVGSGLIARMMYAAETDAVSTAALGHLPLALIPAFAVPLWICLHIAALIQSGAKQSQRVEGI